MVMSKRPKRPPITTIFIACEGRNTEPNYFERISEEVEEDNLLSITVYPDRNEENPKTDALGLIREAQSRLGEFDEVWAVFDKNGYTKHEEAFQLAAKLIDGKRVNIAFSSISFEHWVLLHFEKDDTAYEKSQHIVEQKFRSNEEYYPEYHKRAEIDIYPRLRTLTDTAIENASWIRFRRRGEINAKPIYELNPYTNVDELVKRLFGINTLVDWLGLNELYTYKAVHLTIVPDNENLLAIISHHREASLISSQFIFTEIFQNFASTEIAIEKQIFEPDNEYRISLGRKPENLVLVKIEFERVILFIEI